MATRMTMRVLLGPELWDSDLVGCLVGMGHEVMSLPGDIVHPETPTIIISRKAWRVPKAITQAELLAHIGMILKQARLLDHEDTPQDPTPGRVGKQPKSATPRKRAAKKAASNPANETQAEGPVGSTRDSTAGVAVTPRKRVKENTDNDSGC